MKDIENSLIYKDLEREEFDYPLLVSALTRAGYSAPTKKIHDLVRTGVLIGVKKGLYTFAPNYTRGPICKETLANLIYGPSCISLEYALAYYKLIPERVDVVTSITPKKDKRFETPLGIFTYRYLVNEKYREGIDLIWIDAKHPVLMACREKALCDYVVLKKISHLKKREDASQFLSDDLRIDQENLKLFDLGMLHRLNRIYRSKSVDVIVAFLEGTKSWP